jgi:hypothetical protein
LLILLFKNVLKISNFEKSAKMSKNLKKPEKNGEKKLQKKFCLGAFMREEKISLIKKACFMLNYLKSKAIHLFFWVASSLSILCPIMQIKEIVERRHGEPIKFLFLSKMGLLGSQAGNEATFEGCFFMFSWARINF